MHSSTYHKVVPYLQSINSTFTLNYALEEIWHSQFIYKIYLICYGRGGALVETTPFVRKGHGFDSRSTLLSQAATWGPWASPSLTVACGALAWNSGTVSVLCRERLWVVGLEDLKRRYRNNMNEWMSNRMRQMRLSHSPCSVLRQRICINREHLWNKDNDRNIVRWTARQEIWNKRKTNSLHLVQENLYPKQVLYCTALRHFVKHLWKYFRVETIQVAVCSWNGMTSNQMMVTNQMVRSDERPRQLNSMQSKQGQDQKVSVEKNV